VKITKALKRYHCKYLMYCVDTLPFLDKMNVNPPFNFLKSDIRYIQNFAVIIIIIIIRISTWFRPALGYTQPPIQ
jgi:hypothetical protein